MRKTAPARGRKVIMVSIGMLLKSLMKMLQIIGSSKI